VITVSGDNASQAQPWSRTGHRICGTFQEGLISSGQRTRGVDAPVIYIPGFLAPEIADTTLVMLLAELPWERRISRMYGEDVPVPRMEVWVGDHAYTYSHGAYQPICWTPTLLTVKSEVEAAADCKFNGVLVNRYENEKDYFERFWGLCWVSVSINSFAEGGTGTALCKAMFFASSFLP
jgi:alkylated DNA repair dioxygenase AlkB